MNNSVLADVRFKKSVCRQDASVPKAFARKMPVFQQIR
jgi:hypothetical protein